MRTLTLIACCALALPLGAAPASKKAGAEDKGKETFNAQCAVCHSATTTQKKLGPSLKGLFKNAKMADGKKPTEANVRAKIDAGGNGMPGYKDVLSDEEKNNLIAYLKTL